MEIQTRIGSSTTVKHTQYATYTVIPDIAGNTAFVRNVATGRCMEVESASTANGGIVQQNAFGKQTKMQWIFELGGGGYFKIKNVNSGKYLGVDSSDITKVKQYSTVTDYTLWKLTETSNGKYKISCKASALSGKVLSTPTSTSGNGADLTMLAYASDSDYKDEWLICDIAMLLAINDSDGANRHSYFSTTASILQTEKNGSMYITSSGQYSSLSVSNMINYLQSYSVFFVHTHGTQTSFKISNSGTKFLSMNDLSAKDLSNLRLAVLLTCETGKNYNSSHIGNNAPVNIVEKMVICGAETVVGFKEKTFVSDCNMFAEAFTRKLIIEEFSICDAINQIDYTGYLVDMSRIAVVAGNANNKLIID